MLHPAANRSSSQLRRTESQLGNNLKYVECAEGSWVCEGFWCEIANTNLWKIWSKRFLVFLNFTSLDPKAPKDGKNSVPALCQEFMRRWKKEQPPGRPGSFRVTCFGLMDYAGQLEWMWWTLIGLLYRHAACNTICLILLNSNIEEHHHSHEAEKGHVCLQLYSDHIFSASWQRRRRHWWWWWWWWWSLLLDYYDIVTTAVMSMMVMMVIMSIFITSSRVTTLIFILMLIIYLFSSSVTWLAVQAAARVATSRAAAVRRPRWEQWPSIGRWHNAFRMMKINEMG